MAAQFCGSKKQVSSLDETDVALTKDLNGLHSLIQLNAVFSKYENLFNQTTSVECKPVCVNQNITEFLFHLSPYFLQEATYCCLQWLIQTYHINENNIDSMMALILPYHETSMFVKCLRIMPLHKSSWCWMQPIQRSGVTLSRQILIDKAASDRCFFEFILRTVNAVDELNGKANALDRLFEFYTIITLGALDAGIKDFHLSNITGTILKGLSSNAQDFCASSMAITGFLATKIEFEEEFLHETIKILAKVCHDPEMKEGSLLTLCLIYQTQQSAKILVKNVLTELIDETTITTMIEVHKRNNIVSLCLSLITESLENVQKGINTKQNQQFVEKWMSGLCFNSEGADAMIRCILNGLRSTVNSRPEIEIMVDDDIQSNSDDIQLISSDEDEEMVAVEKSTITQWYARLFINLEKRYSYVYDAVRTDIMSKQDKDSSFLKIVLDGLFCTEVDLGGSGSDILLNLYHPSEKNRQHAVKELVKKCKLLEKPFSNDKMNLLLSAIDVRLSDNSPHVVNAVLQFETRQLVEMVGVQTLIRKLKNIIGYGFMAMEEWQQTVRSTIKHITSENLSTNNEIEIFLAIWPYMFPYTNDQIEHTEAILKSTIATSFPIVKQLRNFTFKGNDNDLKDFDKFVNDKLTRVYGVNISKINQIIGFVTTLPDAEITKILAFHIINLLTHLLKKNSDPKLSTGVFDIVSRFSEKFQLSNGEIDENAQLIHTVNALEALPVQVIVKCIQSIIKNTCFRSVTRQNEQLTLAIRICDNLCTGIRSELPRVNCLYNNAILDFFKFVLPSIDKKVVFFSNFFINHYMDQPSDTPNWCYIDPIMQLRNIQVFNKFLNQTDDQLNDISMDVYVRIISGLTSPFKAIRTVTCDTIGGLHKLIERNSRFHKYFRSLSHHRYHFESCPAFLSQFLCNDKHHKGKDFFALIKQPESTMIMKAALLIMLEDIDDIESLDQITTVTLDILNKIDTTDDVILSHHESTVIYKTIARFNSDTISSILSPGNCRHFFEKVLQQSNVFVRNNNKLWNISVLMMDVKISEENVKFIIESIIKSATFSDNEEVWSKAEAVFSRSIQSNGKVDTDILMNMYNIIMLPPPPEWRCDKTYTEILLTLPNAPDPHDLLREDSILVHLLQTPEWKCGKTFLEFLLAAGNVPDPHGLLRELFRVLESLNFNYELFEYTKQLVLRNLLKLMPPQSDLANCFNVRLVVNCLFNTRNAQTHSIALELLEKLTEMRPLIVIDNIVDVFKFPKRKDDADSYKLIYKIIESKIVVPLLDDSAKFELLKKLSDAIMDVPSLLYFDLLGVLDPTKFLYVFLEILFESDVRKQNMDEKEPSMELTQIAIDITNQFDCNVIIKTCINLITFLYSQLNSTTKIEIKIDKNCKPLNVVTFERCVLYRYLILHFINVLIGEESEFATKMEPKYKNDVELIVWDIVKYIKVSVKFSRIEYIEKDGVNSSSECFQILGHLLDIHSPELLTVVNALLSDDNDPEVRLNILDLLNKKLLMDCNGNFLSVLGPLTAIIQSILDTKESIDTTESTIYNTAIDQSTIDTTESIIDTTESIIDTTESIIDTTDSVIDTTAIVQSTIDTTKSTSPTHLMLQLNAMRTVNLLSRALIKFPPGTFLKLLEVVAEIFVFHRKVPIRVRDFLFECLCQLCATYKKTTFMSPLKTFLDDLVTEPIDANARYFGPILQGIVTIIKTREFLVPNYLVDLIAALSIVWSHLLSTPSKDHQQQNLLKLQRIWDKLSKSVGLRALLPMVKDRIYPDLLKEKKFNAIGPLMSLLLLNIEDAVENDAELMEFLIDALSFRTKFHTQCETVDMQENIIIGTVVEFILQLAEPSFVRIYNKLHEWSKEDIGPSFDRAVTFYRFSIIVAEKTKQLRLTFATTIIEHSVALLQKNFTEAEINASSTKPVALIFNILETLHRVFLYNDSSIHGRLTIFMEPLLKLLDKEEYLMNEDIIRILPKCVAKLTMTVNDYNVCKDTILSKIKNNSVVVIRCALICYVEVIIHFGEDVTQFYPDVIPILNEVLQIDDREIEDLCRRCIQKIEECEGEVGEPFRGYFNMYF